MEILFAILLAAAFAHAVTPWGRDAVREGARSFRAARAALRGRGDPAARKRLIDEHFAGRRSGRTASNAGIIAAAAWRGYRRGWTGETARQRAAADDEEVDDGDEQHDRFRPNPDRRLCMAILPNGDRCANPALPGRHGYCAECSAQIEEPEPASPANPRPVLTRTTSGGTTMTIATATGGEILSYPQLLAELDSIVAEAAAEMEDRQAARQRAQDDVARIDLMLASLGKLELDTESLAKLQAIAETNDLKMRLATQAADNAEHRHALAVAAKETVVRKHQQLQEAHMAAGRDAAQKQFYQAG